MSPGSKFDIRIEGPFEYKHTDGPFTMDDLQRHWPEYLINHEPSMMLTLVDNEGNVVHHEPGRVEDCMRRDWVTLDEWNND